MIDGGAALHDVSTATTVRFGDQGPVVVDAPFTEAKEVIGGFSIIDVPDVDAAIALARTWPSLVHPGNSVEIRPMFDDEEIIFSTPSAARCSGGQAVSSRPGRRNRRPEASP
ncbi:MAG TPA: YciI family protein [Microbacterium sp.]|nr:YciI family protein [Microbacterium sp.]